MNMLVLRRLSGIALVLGAIGCLAGGMLHPVVDGHAHSVEALTAPHELVGSLALLTGTVLVVLGLPGVYGWLADRLGWLGLLGTVAYIVGNVMVAVPHVVVMSLIGPDVARRSPDLISEHDLIIGAPAFEAEQVVFGFVFVLGALLLSLAVLRAAGIPRWIGAVGLAGTVLMLVPLPGVEVLSGLQVELGRAVMTAALGVLAVRSTQPSAGQAPGKPLSGTSFHTGDAVSADRTRTAP